MSMATAVSFCQGLGPLANAPMFPQLMEAFDCSLADAIQFTGVCILVLGFSNFIWYASWEISLHPNLANRTSFANSIKGANANCIW
jgi:hypothetical protein